MKVTLIGGGSWGTTLAQVLTDNNHDCLIYDINKEFVRMINCGYHPFFPGLELEGIQSKATFNLDTAINHGEIIVLSVPTKAIRSVLKEINPLLTEPKIFVNVSKGIEPNTSKRVSEIVEEEIDEEQINKLYDANNAEKLTILYNFYGIELQNQSQRKWEPSRRWV